MKKQLIDELANQFDAVHECYRPKGGPCFYIASTPVSGDYGRRQGRRFVAAVETQDGTLRHIVSMVFLVTEMARFSKSDLIGDPQSFYREVGLGRFRTLLDRDFVTERDEEVLLTKDSDDVEFQRPSATVVIRGYQLLKSEILQILAAKHARGVGRVPASTLLKAMCNDVNLINRALNELVELKLIRDLNHSSGMRLTANGQTAAEATLLSRQGEDVTKQRPINRFDFFISYAREDLELAEALDTCLAERGFTIWRDSGQLTLGDSLTDKINEGLAESRFGIVIISKAFLRKNWPKAELNALQARAISEGQKVILPIRLDLDHEEMAKHLPLLGDKITIAFDQNIEEIADEIERAVGSPSESQD